MNAPHRKLDLVVFDMAGTTVADADSVHRCLMDALERAAGIRVGRDACNRVMGIPKPTAILQLIQESEGARPADARVEQVFRLFRSLMSEHYRLSPLVKEIDGCSELLAQLKAAGLAVGLDTGFSRDIAQVVLERMGWEANGLIDAWVCSDDVPQGRPAPYMIYRLMEATGVVDVARVAKVGDTPSDLHEGFNARCGWVIGTCEGSHTADELRAHPHTHLVARLRDLPEVITIGRPTTAVGA